MDVRGILRGIVRKGFPHNFWSVHLASPVHGFGLSRSYPNVVNNCLVACAVPYYCRATWAICVRYIDAGLLIRSSALRLEHQANTRGHRSDPVVGKHAHVPPALHCSERKAPARSVGALCFFTQAGPWSDTTQGCSRACARRTRAEVDKFVLMPSHKPSTVNIVHPIRPREYGRDAALADAGS